MAEITSNCGWKSLRSSRIGKAVLRPLGHLGVMVLASPFIQANENQSTFAQDLLQQAMADCGISLSIVAEHYRVPDSSDLVAIP